MPCKSTKVIEERKMKTYRELRRLNTFEDRYEYLKLNGRVGEDTFGFDRFINQGFYRSVEWKQVRDKVIIRDNGCDLGDPDHPIYGRILIHHMNPIRKEDFDENSDYLLNPDYLVCVSHNTHNAIHYGDASLLPKEYVPRRPNDTCPWKR